jgi:hypothetical protein
MIHLFELWKFSNKKYCLQKFIQKNFSSHHPSFKNDFQKFIKSLHNWIQISTPIHFSSLWYRQGISMPKMAHGIRSYLSTNLPLFLFCPITLLQLPKCHKGSNVPVTRCHAFLQPSFTSHMSRSHLHVKHNSYMHTPSSPYIWGITRSFLLHLYTIFSLYSIHLRQAIKVCRQIPKLLATMSYSEKDDFPVNPLWVPSGKLPMMSITHSTTWLVILADQTIGYTAII